MTRPHFKDRTTVRTTLVGVKMSERELEELDAHRRKGEGRSTCLRRLALWAANVVDKPEEAD